MQKRASSLYFSHFFEMVGVILFILIVHVEQVVILALHMASLLNVDAVVGL